MKKSENVFLASFALSLSIFSIMGRMKLEFSFFYDDVNFKR